MRGGSGLRRVRDQVHRRSSAGEHAQRQHDRQRYRSCLEQIIIQEFKQTRNCKGQQRSSVDRDAGAEQDALQTARNAQSAVQLRMMPAQFSAMTSELASFSTLPAELWRPNSWCRPSPPRAMQKPIARTAAAKPAHDRISNRAGGSGLEQAR